VVRHSNTNGHVDWSFHIDINESIDAAARYVPVGFHDIARIEREWVLARRHSFVGRHERIEGSYDHIAMVRSLPQEENIGNEGWNWMFHMYSIYLM
jgi:hypothetical protein